jgi:hypothetical protein
MRAFNERVGPAIRRSVLLPSLAACALLLSACGVGGADDSAALQTINAPSIGTALVITTTSIPSASEGVTYDTTALQASGADGTLRWRLASGTLPPGIGLAADGRLSGVPTSTGFYAFVAEASDGADVARQPLALAVDTFGITASAGLRFGDAWSGTPVTLQCAGFDHEVAFSVVRSDSGGRFLQLDPEAGTAIWMPGPHSAAGAQDVLLADCGSTGARAEIALDVAPDTTAGHVAEFGSSDVWFLDTTQKHGAHPYSTDMHAALARLGLRQSTGAVGAEADQLASLLVHVKILQEVNRMFLRNADGTSGAEGLAISFPLEAPGPGYATPVPGGLAAAGENLFSVMCLGDQDGSLSAFGVAMADTYGNVRVENNSPGGAAGELGVFANYVAQAVENNFRLFGDELRRAPIGEADVPALKALLYGQPSPGGRYELIGYFVHALAEALAYISAHETAHSLGLGHTHSYTPGSIMNNGGLISPGAEHFFLEEDLAVLRAALPGGGRGTSALTVNTASVSAVTVCDGSCAGG